MEIKKSVDSTIDEVVALLQRLIKIDSQEGKKEEGCPFGRGPKEALDVTLDYCKNLGFKVKNIDNYVGWAEVGDGEELIGIPVHLDIVPQGKGWNVEPFGGEIIDGIIYGRGAVDNKGPVAMLIHVVNNIKKEYSSLGLGKRIRLIFGTNEETGMECIKYYLKNGEEIPTVGFTPDAMYPVVNGEKGRLHILIKKDINVDTKGCYIELNGGTKENVVPSECNVKIYNGASEESISTQGVSAHGSSPEKGENSISKMLSILVEKNIDIQNIEDIRKIYDLLGRDYNGEGLGIYTEDDIFKKNTVNLGILRINEKEIVIELDIRHGMNISGEEVVTRIKEKFEAAWEISVLHSKNIHYVKEDAEVIKKLLAAYEEVTGEKGYCLAMGGGTYASSFDNMVAFGPKFMDYRTGGHGIDERVPIAHLKISMEIYTRALLSLLDK